ncbi:MAG: FISUMP domain-containing protein [Prolixibacteraceae bacterium]
MKKLVFLLIVLWTSMTMVDAQNVGVNADGTPPANSAMLDVKSTSKGFLLPRMTQAQRDAIPSPENGLMVFCTDCGIGALSVYTNGSWLNYNNDCPLDAPTNRSSFSNGPTLIAWLWNAPGSGTATGYKFNTTNDLSTAIDKGSNNYFEESGLTCNTSYTRYIWAYNKCTNSASLAIAVSTQTGFPNAATAGVHSSTPTQITWNWSGGSGATSFKWNTTNNLATATDIGNVRTYTETGLNAFTKYTRYVWPANACGTYATAGTLTTGTQAGPCAVATVDYGGTTYHTLQMGTQCWLKENLNIGAKITTATLQGNNSVVEKYCYDNDEANCTTYGGLYQWAEAVQYQNGATNTTLANPALSGNVQGICPTGWHIPTQTEMNTLSTSISTTYTSETFKALCEAGNTHWSAANGTNNSGFTALGSGYTDRIYSDAIKAYFMWWTSTESNATTSVDANIIVNTMNTFTISIMAGTKAKGFSVRCLKD